MIAFLIGVVVFYSAMIVSAIVIVLKPTKRKEDD